MSFNNKLISKFKVLFFIFIPFQCSNIFSQVCACEKFHSFLFLPSCSLAVRSNDDGSFGFI
jgi:hypothetical protein